MSDIFLFIISPSGIWPKIRALMDVKLPIATVGDTVSISSCKFVPSHNYWILLSIDLLHSVEFELLMILASQMRVYSSIPSHLSAPCFSIYSPSYTQTLSATLSLSLFVLLSISILSPVSLLSSSQYLIFTKNNQTLFSNILNFSWRNSIIFIQSTDSDNNWNIWWYFPSGSV